MVFVVNFLRRAALLFVPIAIAASALLCVAGVKVAQVREVRAIRHRVEALGGHVWFSDEIDEAGRPTHGPFVDPSGGTRSVRDRIAEFLGSEWAYDVTYVDLGGPP